jgi:Tol biopolymer transport system component
VIVPRPRNIAVVAGLLVAALLGVGIYLGAWRDTGEGPGHLAVIDSCGILTMRSDGTDWRFTCLSGVWSAVSVSGDGNTLAWDMKSGTIAVANGNGSTKPPPPLPTGVNFEPGLSPDGHRLAFLHSPRDDGRYDVWAGSTSMDNAEQLTATRSVSSVAWSPQGTWIAYVNGLSEDTLEGGIRLIRPNGKDDRLLAQGDAPAWAPSGNKLVFVHGNDVWTMNVDGNDRHRLVRNGHSPAWSRDGRLIAFMRADPCKKIICTEHAYLVSAAGGTPKLVGPQFSDTRRLLWVTNKSVGKPPPK